MRRLLILVLAAGCGPSSAMVKEARRAEYDVTFPEVWNVVADEVHRKYPGVKIEDPVRGVIETEWRVIEVGEAQGQSSQNTQESQQNSSQGGSNAAPGSVAGMSSPAKLFRVMIEVRGRSRSGPWHVNIDGEAAEYQPGMAMLTPYRHGLEDEPPWVETRIDSITVAIHNRLRHKMVKVEPVTKKVIAEKVHDTTPWASLPDREAVALIGRVHASAVKRDTAGLRGAMSDDFEFNEGAEGSADTAIVLWSADPSKMKDLAHAIEDGCVPEPGSADVVCPAPEGPGKARARFRKVGDAWKLVAFGAR